MGYDGGIGGGYEYFQGSEYQGWMEVYLEGFGVGVYVIIQKDYFECQVGDQECQFEVVEFDVVWVVFVYYYVDIQENQQYWYVYLVGQGVEYDVDDQY